MVNALTAVSACDKREDDVYRSRVPNSLSAVVCLVSAIHYTHILKTGTCPDSYRNILYSDWLVTVPLLIVEFWMLLKFPIQTPETVTTLFAAMALSVWMVLAGYFRYYTMSWVCLLAVYVVYAVAYSRANCANDDSNNTPYAHTYPDSLIFIFIGIWLLYGIVETFHISHINRIRGFSLLDILCKAVFGLTIALLV